MLEGLFIVQPPRIVFIFLAFAHLKVSGAPKPFKTIRQYNICYAACNSKFKGVPTDSKVIFDHPNPASLECLSKIHRVDIPELPEIQKKRKERAEKQKARMKRFNELAKYHPATKEQKMIESKGNVVPFKRKSEKIGRNEPCPCGSGKKYKKCCLNKK